MCDGSYCVSAAGEVRVLPTSDRSNAILCRGCFNHEIGWRRGRNVLGVVNPFEIPTWESLTVYPGAL